MANDTHSSRRAEDEETNNGTLRHYGEKGPNNSRTNVSDTTVLRRSARESSSKKMIPSPSSIRKSERLEKRRLPTLAVRRKSERVEKQKMPSPLRRSGRTKIHSSLNPLGCKSTGSSCSKQKPKEEKSVEQLTFEAKEVSENEENDVGTSQVLMKRMDARMYRAIFKKPNKECHEEMDRRDKSTQEGGNNVGGKIDECFERSDLEYKEVSNDDIMSSEDAKGNKMSTDSRLSAPKKELLENNVTLCSSVPSNATPCETRGAPERVQSDCCREETRGVPSFKFVDSSCSSSQDSRKKFHHFDGSVDRPGSESEDIANKRRKVINDVDQPSKSEGEKLSTGNNEGKSGDRVDTSRSNDIESERIRKLRDEQRSLYLFLKPEIAKLCEVLFLPDDVKSMVDNFLEYIMNYHRVNQESVSILQAFQISVCWTAASLSKHKLDHKASIMHAKQDLNFDCTKEEVDYIYSMLRCLKKIFLYRTGNSNFTGSSIASESSNKFYSYTEAAQEVELAKKDISKSIKEIQKKSQKLLGKLCLMQQEEKQKLKAAIAAEKDNFEKRYEIEAAVIRCFSPNDVRTEKLKVFNSEYGKRIEELKWLHEKRLKELEAKQLIERLKVQDKEAIWVEQVESWARKELLKEEPHNGPKSVALVSDHVAEGKSFDNIVEAMTRTGTGVIISEAPDTNFPVVVLSSSPVELQTPLVKCAGTNEMDIMALEDGSVSRKEDRNIAENEYAIQGNIISNHSHSREQNSDGSISMADEGERCDNFSHESCDDACGEDTVKLALPSSNGDICDGETSLGGEVVLAVRKTSSSNDGQDEDPSSRQGKLDGTILSKPICGFSLGEVEANGLSDGVKNMASLNSQSPEEHIPSVISMCVPNRENAAQIHEADDKNDSDNGDTPNSPFSGERIASLNSKIPEEHVPSVIAMCILNCANSAQIHEADDSNGSNNDVTLNSPLSDERIANGSIVGVLDREVPVGLPGTSHCPENVSAMNPPSFMEQISGGAVNVSVLDREFSRPCGTASPSYGHNANTLLNQPSLVQQNPDAVSSIISAGQVPVEVPETNHERATVSVLDGEVPVEMPGTVDCTNYPENVAPLNSSSMDKISDGGSLNISVSDIVLSSRPSGASSPSDGAATIPLWNLPSLGQPIPDRVSLSIPDGQIPARVSQTSHEVAESHNDREQLTDSVLIDISTTSDQQEGVLRNMAEYTFSQETPVSSLVNDMEPLEQVQLLSSVESPPDKDTAGEMQNSCQQDELELVSSPVDIVPANQSNHASLVMEPPDQVQQLPSAEFLSSSRGPSNVQPTNEYALSGHIPQASIEVSNQALVQPASNLELDSRSHQAIVHRVSNLDLDSFMPDGVRTQSSDMRNLSTPSEINNHLIQTATQSASMMLPPLCPDPLKNELERIRKLTEQNMKNHEDMKLQLKSDFGKELEELCRKYDTKFLEIEVEFQQTKKILDTSLNTVLVNKILAEAFRSKCMDLKVSGASGMQQDASSAQQLFQFSRQQSSTWPSLVAGPSSCGSPAVSLQSSSTTASSQTMVPPIHAAFNASSIFSNVSARRLRINSISSSSGNLQAGGEIRAPAPHLQPYRPSTTVPGLPTLPHGMPCQPAPSSILATSPSFSHRLPRLTPATYQSDPHRGRWPEIAGGLTTPNFSAIDSNMDANSQSGINLPNVLSRTSDVASFNPSRFGTSSSMLANSAHQAASPDLVCLSDDD